jgi:hypothetical protein
MSKPSVLAVACRFAPSIKSAMRLDLKDMEVDQAVYKQKLGEMTQALDGCFLDNMT